MFESLVAVLHQETVGGDGKREQDQLCHTVAHLALLVPHRGRAHVLSSTFPHPGNAVASKTEYYCVTQAHIRYSPWQYGLLLGRQFVQQSSSNPS